MSFEEMILAHAAALRDNAEALRANAAATMKLAEAMGAITWFNKAGGRVVRGLIVRRGDERDLCMVGVAA